MEAVPPDKGCYIEIFTDGLCFDAVEQECIFAKHHATFPDYPEPYGYREIAKKVHINLFRSIAEEIPSAGLRQILWCDNAEINI
jgi:hypothetical protein